MEELLNKQREIIENIEIKYEEGRYTESNPLIVLNPFSTCPLSALIKFRTEEECSVTVFIEEDIKKEFKAIKMNHEIPILGLMENKDNCIRLVCNYKNNKQKEFVHYVKTPKLPKGYPNIELVTCDESHMYDGMIAMSLGRSEGVKTVEHLYSIIDNKTRVRWIYTGTSCHVFMRLKNGNIIVDAPISSGICGAYTTAGFIEIDMLGKIINFFPIKYGLHHDVIELPNENFLAITQRENTKQDLLVEIDRKSKEVINEWDFREILDFNRETVIDKISVNHPLDWLHLNSLVYDEESNSIIASSRNQSTVVKFNKDTSEIKWILAPHYGWKEEFRKYLLTPIGDDFEWNYAQHTPSLTSEGNLVIFDNGNFRSYKLEDAVLAHNNYSRAVEYQINEENMTVKQVWQYGKERGNELYCPYLGAVRILENNNRLICFGGITKDIFGNPIDDMKSNRMKNQITIIETTGEKVVFEIKLKDTDITKPIGYKCYRAEKISLY